LITEVAPWFLLLITVIVLAVRYHDAQFFSPDSWSYYELSKSVGDDFYRIHTVRTFEFLEPYGSSFPPLWPIAIALGRSIFPSGPETGVFLNLAIVVATAACLEWLFRNIVSFRGAGPLIVLFLLSFRPFREEVLAARSMPLVLLGLTVLAAALRHVSKRPVRMAIVSGLLLGALVMTRFDWLVPAMVLPVSTLALLKKGRRLWLLAVYGTFLITLLPWIAYSLSHFEEVFVSDNSVVALSAESRYVLDFVPAESPTLFTSPGQWIGRLANNVLVLWEMSKRALAGGLLPGAIVLLSLLLGRVVGGLPRFRTRVMGPEVPADRAGQRRRCLLLLSALGPVFVLQALLPPLVLGYGDARYASGVVLLLACIVVAGIVLSCRSQSRVIGVGIGALLAGAILVLLGLPTGPVFRPPAFATQPIAACVDDRDLVMIIGSTTLAAKLGAVHDQTTAMSPSNLDQLDSGAIQSLVQRFSIRFVFVGPTPENEDPAAEAFLDASTISLQASSCLGGLYEVKLASSVRET
jgi:hypothetical protein